MASQGTEPPTARRLREARQAGHVPRSGLLAPLCLFAAVMFLLATWGPLGFEALERWLDGWLTASAEPKAWQSAVDDAQRAARWMSYGLLLALPISLVADFAQVGPVWARRASVWSQARRTGLRGFTSGVLLCGVALAAWTWALPASLRVHWIDVEHWAVTPVDALRRFGVVFLLGAALVVALDVARSRARYLRELHMTRLEVDRERRETQGPRKARRRQRALSRRAAPAALRRDTEQP